MKWYEELGFGQNPFSTDPQKHTDKLVGMYTIVEEMMYRINSGSMLVIEGPQGHGKTSLLMLAAKKFGGKKRVVYVDSEMLNKKLNVTHLLQDRYGMMGRLFNKKPKNMIVLLDNVHSLSKKNTERVKYFFDQNYIKSIVFTTEDYTKAKFSDSLRDRIGTRIVQTPELDEYDAVEIIRKRIGDSELLNDEIIKKIFKRSDNSPLLLLENCERVAKAAVKKDRNRIQMSDIKEVV